MIVIKFVAMEKQYVGRVVRTEAWYAPVLPRYEEYLRLPAREVPRVSDNTFSTESAAEIEGMVNKVIWTGDGNAEVWFWPVARLTAPIPKPEE